MKLSVFIYILIALVVLVGIFFFVQPSRAPSLDQPTKVTSTPKTFELVVKGKKLTSGPQVLQVNEGDEVVIKIVSDEAEELHLHGYDKSLDLDANVPEQLSFTANLTGRFPYELEHSKIEIGALEVLPK
jgi:hypothetical protein